MTLMQKRILILVVVILIAVVLGRLAVRAIMNLLLGGTLFGGNILRQKKGQGEKLCGDLFMWALLLGHF